MFTVSKPPHSSRQGSAGFSLVELTIVVVILGVIAMMGVPRYQIAVEKAKASEAYGYLAHIAKAQEMYRARTGIYSSSLGSLSIQAPALTHFSAGTPSSIDWESRWQLKLTRKGASSGFGAYGVAWCEDGFDPGRSSIPANLTPTGVGGSNQVSSGSGSSGESASPPSGGSSSGGKDASDASEAAKDKKDKAAKAAKDKKAKDKKAKDKKAKDAKDKKAKKGNNGVGNGEGGGRDGNRGHGGRDGS
jgi:type IV pilus assembly protein PilA